MPLVDATEAKRGQPIENTPGMQKMPRILNLLISRTRLLAAIRSCNLQARTITRAPPFRKGLRVRSAIASRDAGSTRAGDTEGCGQFDARTPAAAGMSGSSSYRFKAFGPKRETETTSATPPGPRPRSLAQGVICSKMLMVRMLSVSAQETHASHIVEEERP